MNRAFLGLTVGCLFLQGCVLDSIFGKRAKRETLLSADKEIDSLIATNSDSCGTMTSKLQALKAKVKAELEKVK